MAETSTRSPRKLQPDNLIARLEKLSLAEKLATLKELQRIIDADKKALEEQLAMINS